MEARHKHLLTGIALGIGGTLLALFLLALAVAYSGGYKRVGRDSCKKRPKVS